MVGALQVLMISVLSTAHASRLCQAVPLLLSRDRERIGAETLNTPGDLTSNAAAQIKDIYVMLWCGLKHIYVRPAPISLNIFVSK